MTTRGVTEHMGVRVDSDAHRENTLSAEKVSRVRGAVPRAATTPHGEGPLLPRLDVSTHIQRITHVLKRAEI